MQKIHYRLREGISLLEQGGEFYVLSEIPLTVIRVNRTLHELLCEMKPSRSLDCLPDKDHQLITQLNKLVIRGVLIRNETIDPQAYPSISIVIPVKNRPKDIEECLKSIKSLDYPQDKLETIVVDDGSTDPTREVVQAFDVKCLGLSKSRGASACRNLGVRESRGDLVAFTDSDCVPKPEWIKEIVPYFCEESIGIVGGYVSNFHSRSSLDRYENVKSPLNMGLNSFKTEAGQPSTLYVPSCNMLIRKEVFLKTGGFLEELTVGEDVDLCWRVRKLGYQLLYIPRGEVKHKHRNDFIPLLKRRFDYGTSEAILCLKHRDQRKRISIQIFHSIFYTFLCLGIIIQSLLFFILGGAVLLVDLLNKCRKLRKRRLTLKISKILWSVLRSHFSFFYLSSTYLVRYYSIFFIFLTFFYLKMWLFPFFLLIFPALVDFSIRRPEISIFPFLFFYTMDQLAYQTGVLWGCLRKRNFGPYIFIIERTHKS